MRKRLQKKLCVGPFKEYGFEFHVVLKEGVDCERFLDALLTFIEQNDLFCGGGVDFSGEMSFYVQLGTCKEPHGRKRQMVVDWLEKNEKIHSLRLEPVTTE